MTYEQVTSISQIVALLFFIALFVGVLIYAFWPGNKKQFDDAAKLPLEKDPESENEKDD
jgi:cytochrome c oxidase cbb3-type subunit 4